MRKVTVGIVQTAPRLLDTAHNLKRAELALREAACAGADIVCLPELFASGYYLPTLAAHLDTLAEPADGTTVRTLCALAAELRLYVVAGVMLRESDGTVSNAAVFIHDNGTVAYFYRKQHLFGEEGTYFTASGGYCTADTRFGRVGTIICYDNNFPESARANALMGAELILCPCAWRAEDRDIFNLLLSAHACENTVFFCAVNMAAKFESLTLFGGSRLVNPRGQVIAECGSREQLLCCEIDLDDIDRHRAAMPFLRDRKPSLYHRTFGT
ncbi:MAG: nitrilase-related carbon-nitrogen hydrolase [Oscillospiraceae bacterium]